MTLQTLLRQAVEEMVEAGNEDIDFYNSYSGRGMYGRTCVGVSGGRADCMRAIQRVLERTTEELSSATRMFAVAECSDNSVQFEEAEERIILAEELHNSAVETLLMFDQDSMGRGVILYWAMLEPIVE